MKHFMYPSQLLLLEPKDRDGLRYRRFNDDSIKTALTPDSAEIPAFPRQKLVIGDQSESRSGLAAEVPPQIDTVVTLLTQHCFYSVSIWKMTHPNLLFESFPTGCKNYNNTLIV